MTAARAFDGLRRAAQAVRHAPGLESMSRLWDVLRRPYQKILGCSKEGIGVGQCAGCPLRMPAEFASGSWERYEPEEVSAVCHWVAAHPHATVLDVGCAVGFYSLIALTRSPTSRVIAFDSDLASLGATQRMCRLVAGGRLHVVHGFVSQTAHASRRLSEAVAETQRALQAGGVTGLPGTTAYRCIGADDDPSIPVHRLDDLLDGALDGEAVLLKCDVEGAEQLVLEGARRLLQRRDLTLSISVHPPALPAYGHSLESVRRLIQGAGFRIRVLAVDHEEHWWCER